MMNKARARRGAPLLALALAGCGGVADDLAKPVVDTYVCAFTNCKESDSLALEDISPDFVVSYGDGQLKVEASFGYRANLLTQVRLSSSDRLSASIAGQRHDFHNTDESRAKWLAQFPVSSSPMPSVQLELQRGTQTLKSTAQLPQLSLVQAQDQVTLTRSSGGYSVPLSSSDAGHLTASAEGECTRVDGSRFTLAGNGIDFSAQGAAGDAWLYRVDSQQLDRRLNDLSRLANKQDPGTSPVASCQLGISWALTLPGQLDPAFSKHGRIVGRALVSQRLSYLAGA